MPQQYADIPEGFRSVDVAIAGRGAEYGDIPPGFTSVPPKTQTEGVMRRLGFVGPTQEQAGIPRIDLEMDSPLDALLGVADVGISSLRGMVNKPTLTAQSLMHGAFGAVNPNDTFREAYARSQVLGREDIEAGRGIVKSERLRTPQGERVAAAIGNAPGIRHVGRAINAVGNFIERTAGPETRDVVGSAAGLAALGAPRVLTTRVQPRIAGGPEVARARDYVNQRTSLSWDALPETLRTQLAEIAKDARRLEALDPAAIERQLSLQSLPVPVPATRGQLTRDPVQLRNEGNVSATTAGRPIRNIYQSQNRALLDNLGVLLGRTRGNASSPEQVGQSVQGAARAKLEVQRREVSRLYREAEQAGELQGRAPVAPLKAVLVESPDKTHLGWVQSWLGRAETGTSATLKQLEDLRQAAVARAMDGGTEGYYAGKVIRAIDQATEGAGGAAYQRARAARRAQAMEFEEQGGVARLVENKSRTDRATALEDTWRRTVVGGSIEDLRAVKRSLLTGGNSATRNTGRQAWRDLRAQTLQEIINQATRSVTRFEDGSPNVTPAAMEQALRRISPDKLEELFGPGTVRELNKIMEATRTIKTEPPTGFKGSPTFANVIAFLERGLSLVPVAGDTITGTVRGVAQLRELGRRGREVADAQRTPIGDALRAQQSARRANRLVRPLAQTGAIVPPVSNALYPAEERRRNYLAR